MLMTKSGAMGQQSTKKVLDKPKQGKTGTGMDVAVFWLMFGS